MSQPPRLIHNHLQPGINKDMRMRCNAGRGHKANAEREMFHAPYLSRARHSGKAVVDLISSIDSSAVTLKMRTSAISAW